MCWSTLFLPTPISLRVIVNVSAPATRPLTSMNQRIPSASFDSMSKPLLLGGISIGSTDRCRRSAAITASTAARSVAVRSAAWSAISCAVRALIALGAARPARRALRRQRPVAAVRAASRRRVPRGAS